MEAACQMKKQGCDPRPYIMVPLVALVEELEHQLRSCRAVADHVMESQGVRVPIQWGTMIEVPRAALVANKLAALSDFFSFGTNDLTQMTLGFSRDDAQAKFLEPYIRLGVLQRDPFETIDRVGVGALVRMACEQARRANPAIKLGICGEHGGDPESVAFFHATGLDYVSCSPLRVPIAMLASAQANVRGYLASE